ncbi:rho GTPase-activating protein 11A [Myripristis murdjan]|uniref:Rho GTPase activating protein 11A n=1 Tax=Myripristis murdjan TaxID=586833 RepID=A0A667YHK9_9TELE|nr:rho GTPase-activating protein 11A-like [Myripristis murdjan]XP_029937737.1 rho GTPase-activating protein 11A-like [Myripristis murdjan]
MKVMERNVMRLVAVQHLRAAYGIKTKNWNKNKAVSCKSTASHSAKVFGVPLENLPHCNTECGDVPSFLVDACMKLLAHVDTEGLFRKSGSIVRLKALRAKLDAGEECLSTALPCDVAGLVKQFFRELPEPVLPTELQDAFLKAQQLPTDEDRTSATMLLSCVLPDRNLSILRHFLNFLHNVSQRSAENKMDSSNLSVILAPNLLHSGDGTEKMNASTEKRLKLQAAVVHCFIENAHNFGVLPQLLMEKVPAMMGCDTNPLSPVHDEHEELDINSGMKRRRRSLGVFASATPVIATPNSKRKLPLESGQSFGFSNKKRRSIKKNLGIDLLPNTMFSGTSTPGSAHSMSEALDSSHNALSSAGRQPATSARRKSRRLSNRHVVSRVESGKAGCFSPKVSKKEAPRKSLRLRFSLGKSSKDAGSESIGWRLATQENTTSFRIKDTDFSPSVLRNRSETKSSKYISKSENNLLTPQCDSSAHRTSWNGDTPDRAQAFGGGSFTDTPMNIFLKSNYVSEPAIVIAKPPTGASLPKKLCCASSAESLESEGSLTEVQSQTGPTLLKIKKAFTESGSDIQAVIQDRGNSTAENMTKPPESILMPPPETPIKVLSVDTESSGFPNQQRQLAMDQNITFGQIEIAPLSPLHIDSALFESVVYCSPAVKADEGSPCDAAVSSHNSSVVCETEVGHLNSSRLIDALDIQSPAHFKLGVSSGLQSTPYRLGLEVSTPRAGNKMGMAHEKVALSPEIGTKIQQQQSPSLEDLVAQKSTVADHIQHFNMLTLYSPKAAKARQQRSPLKFQRTPVRQSVRRINSLLGEGRRPTRNVALSTSHRGPVVKAISLESGLSPRPHLQPYQGESSVKLSNNICAIKKPPPVPPKKTSTSARKPTACALGDVTNKVQPKGKGEFCDPASKIDPTGAQKSLVQQVADKDVHYYRGSPRNPLNQGRLLSATKPIDL